MEKKAKMDVNRTTVVKNYFRLIHDLRNGVEESVDGLMKLWHPEGVFEFCGSSPVVGTFKGGMAIATLYKNRLQSSGMKMGLDLGKKTLRTVSLGVVETDVSHLREKGDQVIAGWRTTIGTDEGFGFDLAGSHLFTFEGNQIKNLRLTISPKADKSQMDNLTLEGLSVQDVGRLSLAAWPVV